MLIITNIKICDPFYTSFSSHLIYVILFCSSSHDYAPRRSLSIWCPNQNIKEVVVWSSSYVYSKHLFDVKRLKLDCTSMGFFYAQKEVELMVRGFTYSWGILYSEKKEPTLLKITTCCPFKKEYPYNSIVLEPRHYCGTLKEEISILRSTYNIWCKFPCKESCRLTQPIYLFFIGKVFRNLCVNC